MKKGEKISYLGYIIIMCTNNDGIVLFSPENSHCGNFGTDVEAAKKYALINYMMDKPKLKSSLVNRLAGGHGHWGDYHLLTDCINADGLEIPEDVKKRNSTRVKANDTNFMIIL